MTVLFDKIHVSESDSNEMFDDGHGDVLAPDSDTEPEDDDGTLQISQSSIISLSSCSEPAAVYSERVEDGEIRLLHHEMLGASQTSDEALPQVATPSPKRAKVQGLQS